MSASGEAGGVEVPGGAREAAEGRVWTLTLTSSLPMLNLNQRQHWAQKAALTKHWRRFTFANAMGADLPRNLERVHIVAHIVKATNRQYDVHNLMPTLKACVDGLVTDYGLVPDDTNAHLIGPDLRQGGTGTPSIILTITELT